MGLRPSVREVTVGKNFTVAVSLDSQGKTINNAEAVLKFPADLVEAVSVSTGASPLSLWVESPAISQAAGTVSFNGGAPNPGYSGRGQLMTVTFRAKKAGQAAFYLTAAAVRANDGLGTDILSGASGATVTVIAAPPAPETKPTEEIKPPLETVPTNLTAVKISSPTHPDSNAWYSLTKAIFIWQLPSGVAANQTSFDSSPSGSPTILRRPATANVAVENIKDGVWYFHARFLSGQIWSEISDFKIQVDTAPPTNIKITTAVSDGQAFIQLSADDNLSQVAFYTVQIDDSPAIQVMAGNNKASTEMPTLTAGKHTVTTIAYDQAGNSAPAVVDIDYQLPSSLNITGYSRLINGGDNFELTGLGPKSATVRLSLASSAGTIKYYFAKTAANGEFIFHTEPLAAGDYNFIIELLDKESKVIVSSQALVFTVKSGAIKPISGQAALKDLITPVNLIVLILILLVLLSWYKYLLLYKNWRYRPPLVKIGRKVSIKDPFTDIKNIKSIRKR